MGPLGCEGEQSGVGGFRFFLTHHKMKLQLPPTIPPSHPRTGELTNLAVFFTLDWTHSLLVGTLAVSHLSGGH